MSLEHYGNQRRAWLVFGALAGVFMLGALGNALHSWPGLVHLVALPPFDLFADVRWLLAVAPSRLTFFLGVVGAVAARSVVLTALLGWSAARLRAAVCFYAVTLVPALAAAGLDFTARGTLFAWAAWLSLAITTAGFWVLAPVPWVGRWGLSVSPPEASRRQCRRTLVAYALALVGLGTVAATTDVMAWVLVPVSATLSAMTASRLLQGQGLARWTVAALALPLVIVAGTALVAGRASGPPVSHRPGSLLLVAGVGSASGSGALFHLDPRRLGYSCDQAHYFSYAGSGPGAARGEAACPIRSGAPYEARDTLRPLPQLTKDFAAQIRSLPKPVTVLTHSQGAWIAWAAMSQGHAARVTDLVMLGPFARSLVSYPGANEPGRGAVGSDALRLLAGIGRAVDFTVFDPDAPLPRSLQGTPGAVERVFARALPSRVRSLAVTPVLDAPLVDIDDWAEHRVAAACPVIASHAGLTTSRAALSTVRRFLAGEPPRECLLGARVLTWLTAPFGIPEP